MSFRDNLQHLRATRNMTQEQLAMLLGVSRQSVTKWEAEKSYPEIDKLLKMCQIFECSLDDLVQGDLTDRMPEAGVAAVPAGPPSDICGYDEHQRMMAWKVPTGVAAILLGIAVAFFFEDALAIGEFNGNDGLFILIMLVGILAGLALLIPAGMEHGAFQKAHPYVEDFYTEDDKVRARKTFSAGLIAGIAFIFAGIGCFIMLEGTAENIALFFLMFFIAIGVWNILHYSMLLARTNVAEYNKSVGEDLELEEIMDMQVDETRRGELLRLKRKNNKLGAVCAAIMIAATIVGLALLFGPALASPNPDAFEPEGTPAMWFWLSWPIGCLICGIVAVLWDAFGKQDD